VLYTLDVSPDSRQFWDVLGEVEGRPRIELLFVP